MTALIQWLDAHQGAVVGLSTVALVVVTFLYVRLTRKALALSRELAAKSDERDTKTREADRAALGAYATALMGMLGKLPEDNPQAEKLRSVTLWSTQDLETLKQLARHHSKYGMEPALRAAAELQWLAEVRDQIVRRTAAHPSSYPWKDEHKVEWPTRYKQALESLAKVRMGIPYQGGWDNF